MDTAHEPLRRAAAGLLLAGSVAFAAGIALTPWESESTTRAYHDALAASPGRAQAAALTLALAYALLAAGCVTALALLAGGRDRWLRRAAAGATGAMLLLPGLLVTDAYDLALAQELPRATSVAVSDATSELVLSGVLGAAGGLGLLLGTTLVAAALWRAREVPAGVPALVVLSWVTGYATMRPAVLLAGACLLVAAYALMTRYLWPLETPAAMEPEGAVA